MISVLRQPALARRCVFFSFCPYFHAVETTLHIQFSVMLFSRSFFTCSKSKSEMTPGLSCLLSCTLTECRVPGLLVAERGGRRWQWLHSANASTGSDAPRESLAPHVAPGRGAVTTRQDEEAGARGVGGAPAAVGAYLECFTIIHSFILHDDTFIDRWTTACGVC